MEEILATQIGYKNGEEFEVFLKELGSENPISEKSLRTIHTQLKETHMLCVVMRGVSKLQPMVISLKSFNT